MIGVSLLMLVFAFELIDGSSVFGLTICFIGGGSITWAYTDFVRSMGPHYMDFRTNRELLKDYIYFRNANGDRLSKAEIFQRVHGWPGVILLMYTVALFGYFLIWYFYC